MSGMLKFGGKARGGGGAARTSLYLIASTGFASLTYQTLNPEHFPYSHTLNFPFNFLNGVVRSSRAIFTITSCVVDYEYSLHGLSVDSNEYGLTLSEIHLRSAKRILKLCHANKGFYVKAGQFVAAMRQVPKEYSSTLSSLQDQAVPCNFKAIKEVILRSLGKDLSEIFFSFDEQPVAAASIAQVHHALLKDGQEVAVKVQYPGLEYQMKFDLVTMDFLSKSVAWLFPEYRFNWMVSEFAKTIASELDFIQEAKNSERTAKNFINNSVIRIPLVFWDFTSSQVLTMQFCKGQKVDDLEYLRQMGISPHKVAKALVEVFAEMIFIYGFLHGDPHPGNILVSPEGPGGFSLVLLDHGIYKQLDEGFRQAYCQLWKAMILMDSKKIQQLGENFGVGKYSRYFPVIFTGRTINSKSVLGRAMSPEERKYLKQEVKSLRMEDVSSFMESLPPDFLTVLRTDGLLRSLISKLEAPQRVRLLAYAKCALRGLYPQESSESGSLVIVVLSRFKTGIRYIQLRLLLEIMDLVFYMDSTRRSLTTRLGQVASSAGNLVFAAMEGSEM
ncbi:Protein kinase superfamily protein [Forsythia ovata]|uniref:Protein kinase superfamily protein n=1 Tax=Forsythia ovata TaxID=205694 RepID=A0ABD1UAA9_9LAMI